MGVAQGCLCGRSRSNPEKREDCDTIDNTVVAVPMVSMTQKSTSEKIPLVDFLTDTTACASDKDPPGYKEQKDQIKSFEDLELKGKETRFLVGIDWWKQWSKYVGYTQQDKIYAGQADYLPGPVNNSLLLKDGKLKPGLLKNMHYYALHKSSWENLTRWYGLEEGSQVIDRQVIIKGEYTTLPVVELYPLVLELFISPDFKDKKTVEFSCVDTIAQLEDRIKEVFDVDGISECKLLVYSSNQAMVYSYNAQQPIKELESKKNGQDTLEQAGIHQFHRILLEGTTPKKDSKEPSPASAVDTECTKSITDSEGDNTQKTMVDENVTDSETSDEQNSTSDPPPAVTSNLEIGSNQAESNANPPHVEQSNDSSANVAKTGQVNPETGEPSDPAIDDHEPVVKSKLPSPVHQANPCQTIENESCRDNSRPKTNPSVAEQPISKPLQHNQTKHLAANTGSWFFRSPKPIKAGHCGLSNLGNTCFMNSALQCMSNTELLRKYFYQLEDGSKPYTTHINKANPLGMGGAIAVAFGDLLEKMWNGKYHRTAPKEFKFQIGNFVPTFAGYNQQDSQELMNFLLDGLHEDLNLVKDKPYVDLMEDDSSKTDEEIAEESWYKYLLRNQSVIVKLFQGQQMAKVDCLECNNVSRVCDPFTFLSLPIPTKKTTLIEVTLVRSKSLASKPDESAVVKYKVLLSSNPKVRELKQELMKLTRISTKQLAIVGVWSLGTKYTVYKDEIEIFQDRMPSRQLFALELLDFNKNQEVCIIVCHREAFSQTKHKTIGVPIVMKLPLNCLSRAILYRAIVKKCAISSAQTEEVHVQLPGICESGKSHREEHSEKSACVMDEKPVNQNAPDEGGDCNNSGDKELNEVSVIEEVDEETKAEATEDSHTLSNVEKKNDSTLDGKVSTKSEVPEAETAIVEDITTNVDLETSSNSQTSHADEKQLHSVPSTENSPNSEQEFVSPEQHHRNEPHLSDSSENGNVPNKEHLPEDSTPAIDAHDHYGGNCSNSGDNLNEPPSSSAIEEVEEETKIEATEDALINVEEKNESTLIDGNVMSAEKKVPEVEIVIREENEHQHSDTGESTQNDDPSASTNATMISDAIPCTESTTITDQSKDYSNSGDNLNEFPSSSAIEEVEEKTKIEATEDALINVEEKNESTLIAGNVIMSPEKKVPDLETVITEENEHKYSDTGESTQNNDPSTSTNTTMTSDAIPDTESTTIIEETTSPTDDTVQQTVDKSLISNEDDTHVQNNSNNLTAIAQDTGLADEASTLVASPQHLKGEEVCKEKVPPLLKIGTDSQMKDEDGPKSDTDQNANESELTRTQMDKYDGEEPAAIENISSETATNQHDDVSTSTNVAISGRNPDTESAITEQSHESCLTDDTVQHIVDDKNETSLISNEDDVPLPDNATNMPVTENSTVTDAASTTCSSSQHPNVVKSPNSDSEVTHIDGSEDDDDEPAENETTNNNSSSKKVSKESSQDDVDDPGQDQNDPRPNNGKGTDEESAVHTNEKNNATSTVPHGDDASSNNTGLQCVDKTSNHGNHQEYTTESSVDAQHCNGTSVDKAVESSVDVDTKTAVKCVKEVNLFDILFARATDGRPVKLEESAVPLIVNWLIESLSIFVCDWDGSTKEQCILFKEEEKEVEHNSCSQTTVPDPRKAVELKDCLALLSDETVLDNWFCTGKCQALLPVLRTFKLSKLPTVLIVHLKRFSTDMYGRRTKLGTFVRYPIKLELRQYVAKHVEVDPVYELFAICNHTGTIQGGHYTAYAKTKDADGKEKWLKFDDTSISEIAENKLVTPAAYVLFYSRCDPQTPPIDITRIKESIVQEVNELAKKYGSQENIADDRDSEQKHLDNDTSETAGLPNQHEQADAYNQQNGEKIGDQWWVDDTNGIEG